MQTVCVVGLGYVGLPLAVLCAEKGFKVKGLDTSREKVSLIKKGTSPINDSVLQRKLKKLSKKISVSTSPKKALENADIIAVCVPTPAKGNKPDLVPLRNACETIAGNMPDSRPLVVIESTVYPGTVRNIVKPILEKHGREGKDFFLCHCPERIDPGNKRWTLPKIPRVCGALGEKGAAKCLHFYKSIIDAKIVMLSKVEEAEAVKVVENTFRDVNIAFVNELAESFDAMGIDLSEVIRGASTKPFGYMPFYPGPGVGGHCISIDPYYLIASAKEAGFEHRFLALARQINKSMPSYVVKLTEEALQQLSMPIETARIVVLGIAYKPDVDDTRESPALKIIELLRARGAKPLVFDPFVQGKSNVSSLEIALRNCDLLLLATHHKQFMPALSAKNLERRGIKAVVDSRNALDKAGIAGAGILYKGVGR